MVTGTSDLITFGQIHVYYDNLGACPYVKIVGYSVLTGLSLGEYAALALSGALSLEDTLRVVALRARLMAEQCIQNASGMLACRVSPAKMKMMMEDNSEFSKLCIACINSPDDCVVAGSTEQLSKLEKHCTEQYTRAKRLQVPLGFHSDAMDPIMRQLEELGHTVPWSEPILPIVSTLSELSGIRTCNHVTTLLNTRGNPSGFLMELMP